ncbi:MAG TPA: GH25 family lysozyme [Chthonomonadaceae bacterium]|nr:GH25 family lysozyme [Chthonomonadaceae bacterium]
MRYDSFKASLAGIGLLCLALGAFFPAVMRRPALCGRASALREECALFSVPAGASSRTPHGLDIASYAGPVRLATWEQLKQDGLKFAVVSGWQGRGRNRYARRQLAGARQAGLKTAAYCLLNFDRQDQSGAWQVRQALAAIGGEPVCFLALDIETVFFPRRLSAAPALKRIREAVAATRRAGIAPVLYTGRHAWQVITRDCADADLARLPLWDARYAPWLNEETDDLASDADGPWRPYGGWRRRLGKQYGCEKSQTGECLRLQYDLNADPDVFDPTAWKAAGASPRRSDIPAARRRVYCRAIFGN